MKQPFAVMGLAGFCTAFLLGYVNGDAAFLLFGGCLAMAGGSLCFKRVRRTMAAPLVLLTAASLCLVFGLNHQLLYKPAVALGEQTGEIRGTLLDVPRKTQKNYRYTVRTSQISISGAPQEIKLFFSSPEKLDAEPYDQIQASVRFYSMDAGTNGYRAKNIFAGSFPVGETVVLKTEKKPFMVSVLRFREALKENITQALNGQEGALITGMLLGDRSGISDANISHFRAIGLSHILAVSGFHTAVWSALLLLALKKLHCPRIPRYLLAMASVLGFMALTGFSFSVMRAGIMVLVLQFGQLIGRERSSLNSLGFAVWGICLFQPYSGSDLGFLLSASATLGILLLAPFLHRKWEPSFQKIHISWVQKIARLVLSSFEITLSAVLFSLPFTILYFSSFCVLSPVSNLFLLNFGSFAMVAGGIGALLSCLPFLGFLSNLFFLLSGLSAKFMLWGAALLSRLSFLNISCEREIVLPCLLAAGALVLFFLFLKQHEKLLPALAVCVAMLFFGGTVQFEFFHRNLLELQILDVGNGMAVLACTNEKSILIGCGGDRSAPSEIFSLLQEKNISVLDAVLIPGTGKNVSSATEQVLRQVPVRTLFCASPAQMPEGMPNAPEHLFMDQSIQLEFGGNLSVFCMGSKESYVIGLQYGKERILFSSGKNKGAIPIAWRSPAFYLTTQESEETVVPMKTILLSHLSETEPKKNLFGGGNLVIQLNLQGKWSLRRNLL